jgi:hypothetical protein
LSRANVVHHLQQIFDGDQVAVLYVYCDYKDKDNQTDPKLFANLAKQSILQQAKLPTEANALYCQCKRGEISPSPKQCLDLLEASMNYFRRIFIVIDALDEHLTSEDEYSPEIPILAQLHEIQRRVPGRCSMFFTSREMDTIQNNLHQITRLDIRAHEDDIRSYVNSRIYDDKKFIFAEKIRHDPALAEQIVDKVVEKAQGMYGANLCTTFSDEC